MERKREDLSIVNNPDHERKNWRPLEKMFNEVPHRYDFMNRMLTFRFDVIWRRKTAKECLTGNPGRVLDLCTGTGDLAIEMARQGNGKVEICGLDYSDRMLSQAKEKALKKGYHHIRFIRGDAADLPFDDESLDAVGIAFAFRNLTYKNPDQQRFLKEIYRVLSVDGKFVIVETSQPASSLLRFLFHLYLRIFVSGIGGRLSGHKKAYHYLAASARNFYTSEGVNKMLLETGFKQVLHKKLLGGIAGITTGIK
jgi:demethylmenaquinone methyltransferase/2-methoxy-6-polyprenyl-1,4-benzoquinol methylase